MHGEWCFRGWLPVLSMLGGIGSIDNVDNAVQSTVAGMEGATLASTTILSDAVLLDSLVEHRLASFFCSGQVQQGGLDALPSEFLQVVAEKALFSIVVIDVSYVLLILTVLHELIWLQVL